MAVTTPRRRAKDPEGRMPLREHLAELRRRVIIATVAVTLGAIAGWYLYNPLFAELQEPLEQLRRDRDLPAVTNFNGVMTALNLHLKGAVYIGIVSSSPVWLYQIWRFITPGLTRKERRTSLWFVAAAVPLFLSGVWLAWTILPRAVRILLEFTPEDASNIIGAEDYFSFATRLILAFGLAFVTPLFLVALNLVGVLSGAQLGRSWRIAVFLIFLFTAMMSPSPDAGTMILMALPMIGLYLLALAFCLLNDRRRNRRREADPVFGLADDEAAPLGPDDAPDDAPVGASGRLEAPAPLDDDRP